MLLVSLQHKKSHGFVLSWLLGGILAMPIRLCRGCRTVRYRCFLSAEGRQWDRSCFRTFGGCR